MLRKPLARIVSDYRYQRSPMHPSHEEVKRRVPDLAAFVELPGQRNRMARHLVPADLVRHQRVEDSIAYIMERFSFVGLQESYALSFRALTALVAEPREPTEKKRVNEGGERVEVTPEVARRVEELNTLDFALYDHFSQRLKAVEEGLAAWLAGREAGMAESSRRIA